MIGTQRLKRALSLCLGIALGGALWAMPAWAQTGVSTSDALPISNGAILAATATQGGTLPSTVRASDSGTVKKSQLPCGLTVVQQHLPTCSGVGVALLVPAGSSADPQERYGCAHFVEHLVYRGTPDHPAGKLALEWERLGARRGAVTTADYAMFWELVPSSSWSQALAIEAGRFKGLVLDKDSLKGERSTLLHELRSLNYNNWRNIKSQSRCALSPELPIQKILPQGNAEDIAKITADDLRKFYTEHYRLDGSILAIVGGYNEEQLDSCLAKLFPEESALRPRTVDLDNIVPTSANVAPENVATTDKGDGNVAIAPAADVPNVGAVTVAATADAIANADAQPATGVMEIGVGTGTEVPGVILWTTVETRQTPAVLAVAEALVWRGQTSRIARCLQRQGWNQQVQMLEPERDGGYVSAGVNVSGDIDTQEVASVLRSELDRFSIEMPTYAEIEASRKRALADFYQHWQEPDQRVQMLAKAQFQGRLAQLIDFPKAVRRCSPAQVMAVCSKISTVPRSVYISAQSGDVPRSYGPRPGEAFAGERYEQQTTDNGIRLLVASDPQEPVVYLSGYIDGGAVCDPIDKPGLTCFAAGLLGKGRDGRTLRDFSEELSERGMTLEFKGDSQVIAISGSCLREDINRFLDILCNALLYSEPSAAEVESWKRSWCQDLDNWNRSPENQATSLLMEKLYPAGHAFGRFYAGSSADVARYSGEEALNHLRTIVRPERLGLCFSGGVRSDVIFQKIEARSIEWPASDTIALPPMPPAERVRKGKRFVIHQEGPELMLVGQLGPGRQESDYYAFNLLNQILAGNSSLSRLPLRVVHIEHLGNSVSSRVLPSQGTAPWAAVMRLRPGKSERALAIVKQEMARLISPGPTPEEIERAKVALENQLILQAASPKQRASLLCAVAYHRLDERLLDESNGVYRDITPMQLHLVAKKWFDPARLTVVISKK